MTCAHRAVRGVVRLACIAWEGGRAERERAAGSPQLITRTRTHAGSRGSINITAAAASSLVMDCLNELREELTLSRNHDKIVKLATAQASTPSIAGAAPERVSAYLAKMLLDQHVPEANAGRSRGGGVDAPLAA